MNRRPTAPVNDWVLWLPLLHQHHGAYLGVLLSRLVSSDVATARMIAALWNGSPSLPQRIAIWLRDNGYTEDADVVDLAVAIITVKGSQV